MFLKKQLPAEIVEFQHALKLGVFDRRKARQALATVVAQESYRQCKDADGQPFTSFPSWTIAPQPYGAGVRDQEAAGFVLDMLIENGDFETCVEMLEMITRLPGNPHLTTPDPNQFYRVTTAQAGHDRMLLRLKKHKPEVLKDLYNGEYDSIRAAATAAGLIRKAPAGHTCLETASLIFAKLPQEHQVEFLVSLIAKLDIGTRSELEAALRDQEEL
jgi:hypothetical protein